MLNHTEIRMNRPIFLRIVLLALLLLTAACSRAGEPAGAPVQMTPVAGGMEMPPLESEVTAQAEAAVAAAASAASATPLPVLTPGMALVAGEAGLALHALPDPGSPIREVYDAGAAVIILEPSGDYDTYPVEGGGLPWYRVRAADGLVGWAEVAALALAE